MKAEYSEDKKTIYLPVPFGTAVFVIDESPFNGIRIVTMEYTTRIIDKDIYLTRADAEAARDGKTIMYSDNKPYYTEPTINK